MEERSIKVVVNRGPTYLVTVDLPAASGRLYNPTVLRSSLFVSAIEINQNLEVLPFSSLSLFYSY